MKNRKISKKEGLSAKDINSIRQLGSGSFGTVELVQVKGDDGFYAMKCVPFGILTSKDKESALNEVRLLASINIPYVIKYEGAFYDEKTKKLCIIMEFANGGDLNDKIMMKQVEN